MLSRRSTGGATTITIADVTMTADVDTDVGTGVADTAAATKSHANRYGDKVFLESTSSDLYILLSREGKMWPSQRRTFSILGRKHIVECS